MSWDIEIHGKPCDSCGHAPGSRDWNVTYNVCPMLVYVEGHWEDLAKLKGQALVDAIWRTREALRDPENVPHLLTLEPSNGWGSRKGLIACLTEMYDYARDLIEPRMSLC